jgi:hypothetical protein
MIVVAGQNHLVGMSLDVLPAVSADGASVDLAATARYTIADPGTENASSPQ